MPFSDYQNLSEGEQTELLGKLFSSLDTVEVLLESILKRREHGQHQMDAEISIHRGPLLTALSPAWTITPELPGPVSVPTEVLSDQTAQQVVRLCQCTIRLIGFP